MQAPISSVDFGILDSNLFKDEKFCHEMAVTIERSWRKVQLVWN